MKIQVKLTRANVAALQEEAAEAGDEGMVRICELALQGNPGAWQACEDVFNDAAAQLDDNDGGRD